MDYLPIQASSVPCERIFSSSTETDTKCCNRIGPVLMEALQMLKFERKKKQLDFTGGWALDYALLIQDDPNIANASEVDQGRALDIAKVKLMLDNEDMVYPDAVELLE